VEVRRNPNYWSKGSYSYPIPRTKLSTGVRAASSAKLVNKMKDYEIEQGRDITDELQSLLSTAEIRRFSDHQITLDIESVP